MALPLFFLGKLPISVIVLVASISILSCAIIIAMCTWRMAWIIWCHHIIVTSRQTTTSQTTPPNRGLDGKILRSLPRVVYNLEVYGKKLTECAICLMEFVDGDVMRVLPHCGHGFHMSCIDRWLECHSSCPSCRDVPVYGTMS
ncbi:43kDa postsynaptic protein [Trema orientale]|uniref:RING-type E3 ubiquitin transferase n=1 Tax=Trema orientale TaxID=63057 RepID=A0A2P5EWJ0_TREOI|nr:43kDa postsynaptic protein [Trema orientale]